MNKRDQKSVDKKLSKKNPDTSDLQNQLNLIQGKSGNQAAQSDSDNESNISQEFGE
jgi:hypothetical protein